MPAYLISDIAIRDREAFEVRESINLVELGLALYTNDLADCKAPTELLTSS